MVHVLYLGLWHVVIDITPSIVSHGYTSSANDPSPSQLLNKNQTYSSSTLMQLIPTVVCQI